MPKSPSMAGVPGVVIRRVQIGKLLVGHACAPAEEGCRVRADRMPQLPGAALDDLEDLLAVPSKRVDGLRGRR